MQQGSKSTDKRASHGRSNEPLHFVMYRSSRFEPWSLSMRRVDQALSKSAMG